MKILILGSRGILGRTLKYYLSTKTNKLIELKRFKNNKKFRILNIKDFVHIKETIINIKPDLIINCIVQKKDNKLNISKEKFSLVNSKFPKFLSQLCYYKKIYLIHISTDSVFSSNNGNLKETDNKEVKDLYSLSKRNGEVKNKYTCTLRTSFIGPEKYTQKSLLSWFLNQKNETHGYSKYLFTGLTSLELSKIIYKYFILKNNLYNNIINIGGKKISKFNLFILISKIFNKKIIIKKKIEPLIDRSLNNKNFTIKTNYKTKSWNKMLKDLKLFMIENNYKF